VVPKAVGLDDQPQVTPQEVDFVGSDARIHLRAGQGVRAAQPKESPLQLASGEVGLGGESGCHVKPQVERLSCRFLKLFG
jgi:hypothetical protein